MAAVSIVMLVCVLTVGHDTVLNGVLEGEDTALGLRLISDVRILLAHANHHTLTQQPKQTNTHNSEKR